MPHKQKFETKKIDFEIFVRFTKKFEKIDIVGSYIKK